MTISDDLCDRLISELHTAADHIEGHGAYLESAVALRQLAQELHATMDPHCTCNDCMAPMGDFEDGRGLDGGARDWRTE